MSRLTPSRMTSGVSTAFPKELLGKYGMPNPLNAHTHYDDFDWLGATGTKYTLTAPNSGTIAMAAGDGGRVLFTTGATSTNPASIQLPVAGFSLTLGRRLWFGARFQVAALSVPSWAAGLIQTTTTIGTVADGIVFEKATGQTDITLKHYVGSAANLTITIAAAEFAPVAAADFDLGFYLDEKGNLFAYGCTVANGGLFGHYPQVAGNPHRQALGYGAIPALTTVNLNPTLGVITNAASAATLNADFIFAAKERR